MDLPLPADRWDIHRLTGDGRTHESFGIRHRGASDGRGAAPHRCMPPVDLSAALTLQLAAIVGRGPRSSRSLSDGWEARWAQETPA
jgi:hypothetical protein